MCWVSIPSCNCSIPAAGPYRCSTIRHRYRSCFKFSVFGSRFSVQTSWFDCTENRKPKTGLWLYRRRFRKFLAERRRFFLGAARRLRLFGDFENDLEAEVFLNGSVERLLVTQPQRIKGRIGGEFRRRSLGRHNGWMSICRDVEGLLQHVFASHHWHTVGSVVIVDRQVLLAAHRMRRHAQFQQANSIQTDGGAGVVIFSPVFVAVAAQQTDDTALDRQSALLDLGIIEGQLETLLQLEGLGSQSVADRAVGDGGARHGDDKHVRGWLSHIDIAAARVRAAVTLRDDMAVAGSQHDRDGRRCGSSRLNRDVHRRPRRDRRFLLSQQRQRQENTNPCRPPYPVSNLSGHDPSPLKRRANHRVIENTAEDNQKQ